MAAAAGTDAEMTPAHRTRVLESLEKLQAEHDRIIKEMRNARRAIAERAKDLVAPLLEARRGLIEGSSSAGEADAVAKDTAASSLAGFSIPTPAAAAVAEADAEADAEAGAEAEADELAGARAPFDAFWMTVLSQHPIWAEMMQEVDEEALHFLVDCRVVMNEAWTGFALEWRFRENPFFTNEVLTKTIVVSGPPVRRRGRLRGRGGSCAAAVPRARGRQGRRSDAQCSYVAGAAAGSAALASRSVAAASRPPLPWRLPGPDATARSQPHARFAHTSNSAAVLGRGGRRQRSQRQVHQGHDHPLARRQAAHQAQAQAQVQGQGRPPRPRPPRARARARGRGGPFGVLLLRARARPGGAHGKATRRGEPGRAGRAGGRDGARVRPPPRDV